MKKIKNENENIRLKRSSFSIGGMFTSNNEQESSQFLNKKAIEILKKSIFEIKRTRF